MDSEVRDEQTHAIIGAAIEVHRQLGAGFLEAVYQEALAVEFTERQISFVQQSDLPVYYKQHQLNCSYRVDFICYSNIIVELKALSAVTSEHHAQAINYLKATGYGRALILNFGSASLQFKRLVLTQKRPLVSHKPMHPPNPFPLP